MVRREPDSYFPTLFPGGLEILAGVGAPTGGVRFPQGGVNRGSGSPTAISEVERAIRWIRESDGSVIAEIYAYEVEAARALQMGIRRDDTFDPYIDLIHDPDAVQQQTIRATAGGSKVVTLIDSGGRSNLLQLASIADLRLAHGQTDVTGDGDSSAGRTIAHGLGRTPLRAFANVRNNGWNANVFGHASTTIDIWVDHVHGSAWSSTQTVDWVAIG